MTRAERRANAEKAKRRAKRQIAARWSFERTPPTAEEIGRHAATPQGCSCYMCGNPRRYFREITLQEQRWNERELAEMEEWPRLGDFTLAGGCDEQVEKEDSHLWDLHRAE